MRKRFTTQDSAPWDHDVNYWNAQRVVCSFRLLRTVVGVASWSRQGATLAAVIHAAGVMVRPSKWPAVTRIRMNGDSVYANPPKSLRLLELFHSVHVYHGKRRGGRTAYKDIDRRRSRTSVYGLSRLQLPPPLVGDVVEISVHYRSRHNSTRSELVTC